MFLLSLNFAILVLLPAKHWTCLAEEELVSRLVLRPYHSEKAGTVAEPPWLQPTLREHPPGEARHHPEVSSRNTYKLSALRSFRANRI